MKKFKILYLISGLLFLVISLISGAWWELAGGDVSKPLLYIGFSPFDFKAELLGSQLIIPSPFMIALFISERLLAILGSATMIVGSILSEKKWHRKLLNLRPFTMSIGFGAFIFFGVIAITSLITRLIPTIALFLPDLDKALMPYSSQYLTVNLYHVMHVDGFLKVRVTSQFTIQFWLALISGVLCLAGMIIHRIETKSPPPPPS